MHFNRIHRVQSKIIAIIRKSIFQKQFFSLFYDPRSLKKQYLHWELYICSYASKMSSNVCIYHVFNIF